MRQRFASWLHTLARRLTVGAPIPPTPNELDELVEHLGFEVAALEKSADLFLKHNYWVFLDAFLLHARLLRGFLWAEPDRRYIAIEVLAEHYCLNWPKVRPPLPMKLSQTKKAINAQLAHISRNRVRAPKVRDLGADLIPIRYSIRSGWNDFLNALGCDRRATALRTAVIEKCALLGVAPPP